MSAMVSCIFDGPGSYYLDLGSGEALLNMLAGSKPS